MLLRVGLSLLVAGVLLLGALFTPIASLNDTRQRLADASFHVGLDRIGYELIRTSAMTGDARALNNLGALLFWGRGTQKSEPGSIVALRDAVLAGSRRAIPNLRVAAEISCARPERINSLARTLEPLVQYQLGGFRQYLADCRENLRDRELIVDKNPSWPSREYIRAAMQADGFVFDAAGAARMIREADRTLAKRDPVRMYELAARMHASCYSLPAELRADWLRPVAAKTLELLLDAAEGGQHEAYALIAELAAAFGRVVEKMPIATRLGPRNGLEWLELGVSKGCWSCRCKASLARSQDMIDRKSFPPDELKRAETAVRLCLQAAKPQQIDDWLQHDEYLAYHSVQPNRSADAAGLQRFASDTFKRMIAMRDIGQN